MKPIVTIILPAYNEQKRIGRTLESYIKYFSKVDFVVELLVVLNGCRDRTLDIVLDFESNCHFLKHLDIAEAVGKGGAVRAGFQVSKGEIICYVDSDLAYGPEELNKLIARLLRFPHLGAAVGSRRLPASVESNKSGIRKICSYVFASTVNLYFNLGLTDTQCGCKAFRRDTVARALPFLNLTNLAFDVGLLLEIRKWNWVIEEVPVICNDMGGGSIVRPLRTGLVMWLAISRLWLLQSQWIKLYFWLRPISGLVWHRALRQNSPDFRVTPKLKLTIISWKDIRHPAAGGAEIVHQELAKRFLADGWEVTMLVPGFRNCREREIIDGVTIIRFGQSILSYLNLNSYFLYHLAARTDYLIDVFNCVSSWSLFDFDKHRTLMLVHHLPGRVWLLQRSFHGLPKALVYPINLIGFLLEKLQLLWIGAFFHGQVATVSNSTKNELVSYSFDSDRIKIISEGIEFAPLQTLRESLPKNQVFTVLMIGIRLSKQPLQALQAFRIFNRKHPDSVLQIVGDGDQLQRLKKYVSKNNLDSKIHFLGWVSSQIKIELLQQAHLLITTSAKEGWGLVVTEASAMGTPVIGYDVPGLRDSLAFNKGLLVNPDPQSMALGIQQIYLLWRDKVEEYQGLRKTCLESARSINFDQSYKDLKRIINHE